MMPQQTTQQVLNITGMRNSGKSEVSNDDKKMFIDELHYQTIKETLTSYIAHSKVYRTLKLKTLKLSVLEDLAL